MASSTTIHSVRLFDGLEVHNSATVTFDTATGLITSVSTTPFTSSAAAEGTVIDGTGHTLLPGLIEAHMHCHGLHMPEGTWNPAVFASALKCGVTTLCDMHSDLSWVTELRQKIKEETEREKDKKGGEGKVTLPDLKSALLGATIEGGWPKPIVLGHNPDQKVGLAFVDCSVPPS
jgi:dihydroorotase-like cyclic amidohydrolase